MLFAGEALRPSVPGFGDTETCVEDILVAEASCIPVLERDVDVFELDLGWRACCDRRRRRATAARRRRSPRKTCSPKSCAGLERV